MLLSRKSASSSTAAGRKGSSPAIGLKPRDREQYRRFEDRFTEFRGTGEFTIPIELGRSNRPPTRSISFSELAPHKISIPRS